MLIAGGGGNFIKIPTLTLISTEVVSTNSSVIQFTKPTSTSQPKGNSFSWFFGLLAIIILGIIVIKYFLKNTQNETVAKKRN